MSRSRSAWVKISNPSCRATAARVMPAASATRTASAVGADTATRIGTPKMAAFWIILTESRLVSRTAPLAVAGGSADQLVEGVVAADILACRNDAGCRQPQRRG